MVAPGPVDAENHDDAAAKEIVGHVLDDLIARVVVASAPADEVEDETHLKFTRDCYGFFIDDVNATAIESPEKEAPRLRRDNSRLVKWSKMLESDMKLFQSNPKLVRRRIRKGIPDAVRGFVWKKLAASEKAQSEATRGYYHQTLSTASSVWEAQIERDIHRTFPRHILFREHSGIGQHSLFNVLKVYSIYDGELGYCQGMGFIAGMFLMHMGEEDSFWMMVRVLSVEGYNMRPLFIAGMPLTLLRIYQLKCLLQKRHPKLYTHLENECVDIMSLSMQWFITNFCYNLPFRVLLRIWDIFLYEQSPKIIFRVALHLFDIAKDQIMKSEFESIMTCMKDVYGTLDPDTVVEKACSINLTTKEIERLEQEHNKANGSFV